jgi:3-dehydroquinate dehydratase type I
VNAKICSVITARNNQELKDMIKKAENSKADFIEIRFDYLKSRDVQIREIRKLTSIPLIATNRHPSEGGASSKSEKQRVNLLLDASKADYDFIDIELITPHVEEITKKIKELGAKVIVSSHNFLSTPSVSALTRLYGMELSAGADVCKIVTTAKSMEDNLTCLHFLNKHSKKGNIICFCMGKLGITSRILSPLFGSKFTYASLEHGKESAPGQLTVSQIRELYRMMGIL